MLKLMFIVVKAPYLNKLSSRPDQASQINMIILKISPDRRQTNCLFTSMTEQFK